MGLFNKNKDAVATARKDKQQLVVDILQKTQYLAKHDIKDWRAAWQQAINVDKPNRYRLYSIYTDTMIDCHLSGCIEQRKAMTMQKAFRIVGKDEKEDRDLTAIFEQAWFKDLISIVLDSRFWGHSLIQLGDVATVNGIMLFSSATLVPRQHVIPEFGVIVRDPNDDPRQGVSYREGDVAKWVIEAGDSHDLGLLLKVTPQAISKKYMLSFWDQFGEVFGMPIRIAKTTSRDPVEREKIFKMLGDMGANAYGVFQDGTEVDILESTKGDAYNVYDKRIERANSEISKAIIGQTMTLENGSSKAQGEVHLEVLKEIIAQDCDYIKDIVNGRLIPLMAAKGFPVEGAKFAWDESIDYTPEEQVQIEQMLLEEYDIDPKYFIEKYNVQISGKKTPAAVPASKGFFD
jgi:hypothetical protein